jgi:S-adenosylmethionine/arginine decarboxylase-like enzyme
MGIKHYAERHGSSTILHYHLLLRAECVDSPKNTKEEQRYLNQGLTELIHDIGMRVVLPARCFYVQDEGNEGWTGNAGLATSHIAYHWWDRPDSKLILNKEAKSLVQLDVYTCGDFGHKEVARCIEWVDDYEIRLLSLVLLDRAKGFYKVAKTPDFYGSLKTNEYKEIAKLLVEDLQ